MSSTEQMYDCYSNLVAYGADGKYHTIIMPTPAQLVPQLFSRLKPHPFKQQIHPPRRIYSCTGYKTHDQVETHESVPCSNRNSQSLEYSNH